MKKLHLVGFTPDNDGLILSPRKGAKSGGYVVALDDDLTSSIDRARRAREGGEPAEGEAEEDQGDSGQQDQVVRTPRPRSALSPREIQARLRAGSTVAEVAAQAGVDDEWVLRFADPILAEQAQVVERARRLTFAKSRLGPSAEALGESVQWNLSDRGIRFSDDVFADCWSAYNLHGARWAVRFSYTSRQRRQVAEWEVNLRERTLSARNRLASDLGHVEPGRRRPRLEPGDLSQLEPAPAVATAADRLVPTTTTTSKRPQATKGRPSTRAHAAKAAGAKRPAARQAGAKQAATKQAATKQAATKQAATKQRATKQAAAKAAAAHKSVARKSPRQSSPKRSRPAKKPSPDKPAAPGPSPAAGATAEPLPERPSHLARPPSPMKMANRATSFPARRPAPPYPPASPAPSRPLVTPPPPAAPEPRAEPAPHPPAPAPAPAPEPEPPGTPAGPSPTVVPVPPVARPKPVAPPIRRRPPTAVPVGADEDQRPAVIILPNPPPTERRPAPPPEPATGTAPGRVRRRR